MIKKRRLITTGIVGIMSAMALAACGDDGQESVSKEENKMEVKAAVTIKDDPSTFTRISVHDPTLVKDSDGTYYVFGSHLAAGKSSDLKQWTDIGGANRLFDTAKLDLIMPEIKSWMNVNDEDLGCWAADVIYNTTTKKYYFYACSSQFGTANSVMWFATSDKIEGPYSNATPIVYSGFSNEESGEWSYKNTNVDELIADGKIKMGDWFHSDGSYDSDNGKMPNAIDPALFYDKEGRMWMSYGSYFGGIYLLEIDVNTGMPIYPAEDDPANKVVSYFGKLIANPMGMDGNGEGPFIIYDKASDYYFLFVTYGNLDILGGYNVRVFKSKTPDGPYEDAAGTLATSTSAKGLKLMGNYQMTGTLAYASPGHSSALVDEETGKLFHVYHTRFNDGVGNGHQIRVHQMVVNKNGFPVVLPYEYDGETVGEKEITKEDVIGTYGVVNHGNITTYSSDVQNVKMATEQTIQLNPDGSVTGDLKGEWSFHEDGSPYVTIKLMNMPYSGVFCYQTEDINKQNVRLVFAASGKNNMTVWGVKKDK